MPSVKWYQVFSNPSAALKIILVASAYSTQVLLTRLLWPFGNRTLSLRTALARMWVGKTFQYNHLILYSEPRGHGAQRVETDAFTAYLVPGTDVARIRDADAVVLFAHGGGYIMGHALQYLDEYRRWIAGAKKMGKNLVVLTVNYPLSVEKKWPAQRDAFLAAYTWLLEHDVPASKIVFAGDSAGGGICVSSMLHLRDSSQQQPPPPTPPQPSSAVLISPWLDLSCGETLHSPRMHNDFIFNSEASLPVMNDALRPAGLPFDTPAISPLLAADVGRLPPQLVYYGDSELLGTDASRWVERSRGAGVSVEAHVGRGQMHTYAIGWPVAGAAVVRECDGLFLAFVFGHVE